MSTGPLGADDVAGDPPDDADTLSLSAADAAGERVDRFVASRLPQVSRSRVQQWIALGAVWCEERALQAATRLGGYETILVRPLPREADQAFAADPVPLSFVHEDDELLVIDKPAGLVVHPAPGNWRGTLMNGLLHHRPSQAALPRAGIVHRLDKDTSGLMVVGATEAACQSLVAQLADRSMSRRYLAWVGGSADLPVRIDAPIGRDPQHRTRMAVVPQGKPAATRIAMRAVSTLHGRPVTMIECALETGRTHQIRVHLAHLGAPLLGDALHGGPMTGIARQALHAWRLELRHPRDGRPVGWRSPPPDDFRQLSEAAGVSLDTLLGAADPFRR
ncbi:MAG TPA: RluA family pseudouridine synthase [Burkholderiaceae bacterium]|nr:RluA family pseudouridine synthase [Burkholderiaceae bacterium]